MRAEISFFQHLSYRCLKALMTLKL